MPTRNHEMLMTASKLLRPVLDELVFVGGCATEVLITDPAASGVRETYDVDVIVQIGSLLEYYDFGKRLQALGFSEDSSDGAPRCRWKHGSLKLDVMPTDESVLGLSSRWFQLAMDNAEVIHLEKGPPIRMVKAAYFVATKLDAFKDRGKNDFMASHDLEDLIAVIDGRPTLLQELREAPEELQEYVSLEITKLLPKAQFIDSLPGHLGYEESSQERIQRLRKTLALISQLRISGREQERFLMDGGLMILTASNQARGALVDVSEGGLQILCQFPGSVGDSVEVRFAPQGYAKEIRVQGKVARVEPDRVGIEFQESSSWQPIWRDLSAFYAAANRMEERYPARGEATVYVAPHRARCSVENVSKGGLQIRCEIPVAKGDSVEVCFTPPGATEQTTAVGRVVRIDLQKNGKRIGIAFPEVSSWQASWRKMVAFRTVSQKKQEGPLTPEILIAQIAAIQQEAAASSDISVKTAALWKMESLGVTFGRIAQPGESLNDPQLPPEACPICHVGMGGAAVEAANFDHEKITRLIDSLAHPKYRLFGYEQIGAMLGVYEKTVPRLMLGLKKLDRPDPAKFLPLFPGEVRRLISHGYGRLLYFNSKDIHVALRNIQKREFLNLPAAVQGTAFGYTMVNHLDLGVVLETGDSLLDPVLVKAFKAGLVYALEFWEWMSPGFLESLEFSSPRATELVSIARREIASARQHGALRPFAVG